MKFIKLDFYRLNYFEVKKGKWKKSTGICQKGLILTDYLTQLSTNYMRSRTLFSFNFSELWIMDLRLHSARNDFPGVWHTSILLGFPLS